MKTAAKIFVIIAMIVGCVAIYPLIVGTLVLKKIEEGKPSVGWCVATMILVSPISGILMLLIQEDEYISTPDQR